jgi:hypothetical protein
MSEERSGKSHALAWTLAIVAVPVLYVLTMPVVAWAAHRFDKPATMIGGVWWMSVYAAPFSWMQTTPIEKPLMSYYNWVLDQLPY